jgi:hypothetical protein
MEQPMTPYKRRELLYFGLAIAIPSLFFLTLPWNPGHTSRQYVDHFFGADVWRVYLNIIGSDEVRNYRDKVHPYFSLFAITTAKSGKLLGTEGGEFLAYRSIFGTAGVFLFWLFIYRCTYIINAFASVALLLSTMTVRIWSILPESYIFGFFTLMLGLNLARARSNCAATLIATMSGTITNASLGILYMLQGMKTLEWKRTIFVFAIAVLLLSSLQKSLYPTSVHFFDVFALREEARYVNRSLSRLPYRAYDFVYSGFVLPLPETSEGKLRTQQMWASFVANYDVGYDNRQALTIVASVLAITIFLLAALANFIKLADMQDVGALVAGFIIFEFLLHLSYGNEPFLYSYHFLPFLVIFMALYLPGERARPLLLGLLAICLQEANFGQWPRFQQMFG